MFTMLVAVDGSEHDKRTLEKVVELSAAMRAPTGVHVLNVQQAPIVFGATEVYLSYQRAEEMTLEAGKKIVDEAAQALRNAGLDPVVEVGMGEIAATIVQRASKLGGAMIVMGTRGMGAVGNLVLGSVATKVIQLSDIPVLLVR